MAVETPCHIADAVAGILVNANLSGHDSHGVLRITSYLDLMARDRLRPKVEPEVVKETDTTFVVNAGFGFGHYTAQKSIELAIDKAKRFNVACAQPLRYESYWAAGRIPRSSRTGGLYQYHYFLARDNGAPGP